MNRLYYETKFNYFLILTMAVNIMSSCNNNRKIERCNIGVGISYEITNSLSGKNVVLTIRHESDTPFPMEIGLIKNFVPTQFSVQQEGKYISSNCFRLNLGDTYGDLVTQTLELRLDNCSDEDNLILWFANRKTIPRHDLYGYRFVRLNSGNSEKAPKATPIQFESTESNPNHLFSLYSTSVTEQIDGTAIELVLDPEKLYDIGTQITNENPSLVVDFLLIAMDGEKLIPFKSSAYMKGSVSIKGSVKFKVILDWKGHHGESISFFLISFPYLDYENAERFEKIIYNSSTHCTIAI